MFSGFGARHERSEVTAVRVRPGHAAVRRQTATVFRYDALASGPESATGLPGPQIAMSPDK